MSNQNSDIFKSTVLGHPSGLFVLFFTEMWERFSYYGMRALLVLFLISAFGLGGWEWPIEHAMALYGTYTALVYITPIIGGYIADNYIGYQRAVIIGAIIMTLGHASMAIESSHIFLYIGIALLIVGNGFFKPNMTSIISRMYKDTPEKKDGAFTIFYMGVNAGAFLGILLCGYIGEKVGWSYGFGLAGIFMLMGMMQFYLSRNIFGDIGKKPDPKTEKNESSKLEFEGDRLNPFTFFDKILVVLSSIIGVTWVINDPLSKIAGINILEFGDVDYSNKYILVGLFAFFWLVISRIIRYPKITRDRMIAIVVFAIMTVIFWMSFEQAGGSMTVFAKDFTNRVMTGNYYYIFLVINILIMVVPIGIITWVLFKLFKQTFQRFKLANMILGSSFIIIWIIVFWMINRDLNSSSYIVSYNLIKTEVQPGEYTETVITEEIQREIEEDEPTISASTTLIEPVKLKKGDAVSILDVNKKGKFIYLSKDKENNIREKARENNSKTGIIPAKVKELKQNEVQIPATWFLILNSLFIIAFAPLFSRWWESKYNPSAASKYGLGLILLGIGFGALAFGSLGIEPGAKTSSVSLIWLVLAYLFHTLGELCLSPVALSYVSKLVPGRMIAMMFGIWYIAVAIGNKLAGILGGQIEKITENYDMTTFFLIFTFIPIGLGLLGVALTKVVNRLMHGVK